MTAPVTDDRPVSLTRMVGITYPVAVQLIAAAEDRLREYQGYVHRGADVAFVVADCHAAIATLREAFGLWPRTEAQLDAAHEAAQADIADLIAGEADVPVALDVYWNRGA